MKNQTFPHHVLLFDQLDLCSFNFQPTLYFKQLKKQEPEHSKGNSKVMRTFGFQLEDLEGIM